MSNKLGITITPFASILEEAVAFPLSRECKQFWHSLTLDSGLLKKVHQGGCKTIFVKRKNYMQEDKCTAFYVECFLLWRLPLHLVMMTSWRRTRRVSGSSYSLLLR